jgi:hypothetical protein
MEGTAQQSKVDTETAQVQAEQELRQEWGREFENNVKKAGALAKANINSDILDLELKSGIRVGDHPELIKGFAKIASMMSEDKIVAPKAIVLVKLQILNLKFLLLLIILMDLTGTNNIQTTIK